MFVDDKHFDEHDEIDEIDEMYLYMQKILFVNDVLIFDDDYDDVDEMFVLVIVA